MSEDLDVSGDHLLINFESGATKYQSRNITQNQIDRVLNASIGSLIDGYQMQVPYANENQMLDNALPGEKGSSENGRDDSERVKRDIVERALLPSEKEETSDERKKLKQNIP